MAKLRFRAAIRRPSVSDFSPVPFSHLFVCFLSTSASLIRDGHYPCIALLSLFLLILSSVSAFPCSFSLFESSVNVSLFFFEIPFKFSSCVSLFA